MLPPTWITPTLHGSRHSVLPPVATRVAEVYGEQMHGETMSSAPKSGTPVSGTPLGAPLLTQ